MQVLQVQLSDALRGTPLAPPIPVLVHEDGSQVHIAKDHIPAIGGKLADVLVLAHTNVPLEVKDVSFRELAEQDHIQRYELKEALNTTLHQNVYLFCKDGTGYRVSGRRPHIVEHGKYAIALYSLEGRPRRWIPHTLVMPADHHGPRTLSEVVADLVRFGRLTGNVDEADPQFFRSEVGANTYHIVCSAPMS